MIQLRKEFRNDVYTNGSDYTYHFFKQSYLSFEHNFADKPLPSQEQIDDVINLIINFMPLPKIVSGQHLNEEHKIMSTTADKSSFDLMQILFILYAPETMGLSTNSNLIKINETNSIPFNHLIDRKKTMRLERKLNSENATDFECDCLDQLSFAVLNNIVEFCTFKRYSDFEFYCKLKK